MSLHHETPPAGGISGFFRSLRQPRQRLEAQPPAPAPIGRRDDGTARLLPSRTRNWADCQLEAQRQRLAAEALAESYINSLRKCDYAFRLLKDEYDELCEQAEMDTVSDKQFAHWLRDRGQKKYREGYPKVTMYKIAPGRVARAA
jgi:hypothetical protein